ncbi:hypothetical protein [Enterococcus sp. DIV0187]|uniref:hypothetical protein n=1 Tax=Enterococcus sp. DIV0187 TaxID=2774644 RepID=UPI003F2434BE
MKSKEESKLTDQLEEMLSRIGELLDKYEECKFFLLENLFVSKNKLTVSSRIPKKEIELQKYREQKEKSQNQHSFDIIATKIASFLKASPTPKTTGQIYKWLVESENINISYGNLSSNILSRMNQEKRFNVERVQRGYWQYRFMHI